MADSIYPSLYQINTRVWMTILSQKLKRHATLDDIPDQDLDKLAEAGFDWIWFLSVWQTGTVGQDISKHNAEWRKEFIETLPDLKDEDIAGSGFAITGYKVHEHLGGDEALTRLRKRLRSRGLKLMLDFVPNHSAIDHPWVTDHPDFFIAAGENELEREPANYIRVRSGEDDIILAHGRDPFFPGWPDTLQLNYGNPALQEAMINELIRIAGQCDGVRCDMAMLVLPDVFEKTWSIKCQSFWPEAARRVHEVNQEFCFMAEVYWDLEWRMLQEGFDYTYDKRLYDRLKEGHAKPVREHFFAGLDYQGKMARFLENHDEPRAAASFLDEIHEAAAIITFLSPGLRFFHYGQFQGKMKRISPHLVRSPEEPINEHIESFYARLLALLRKPVFRNGSWKLLECTPAWDGNNSNEGYISFAWEDKGGEKIVIIVNYSPERGQCYLRFPFGDLDSHPWFLHDLYGENNFVRDGLDLHTNGMYLDEPGWKIYIFSLNRKKN
jgi:hypothetical protein